MVKQTRHVIKQFSGTFSWSRSELLVAYTLNPSICNIVRWFAGLLGQIVDQASDFPSIIFLYNFLQTYDIQNSFFLFAKGLISSEEKYECYVRKIPSLFVSIALSRQFF